MADWITVCEGWHKADWITVCGGWHMADWFTVCEGYLGSSYVLLEIFGKYL